MQAAQFRRFLQRRQLSGTCVPTFSHLPFEYAEEGESLAFASYRQQEPEGSLSGNVWATDDLVEHLCAETARRYVLIADLLGQRLGAAGLEAPSPTADLATAMLNVATCLCRRPPPWSEELVQAEIEHHVPALAAGTTCSVAAVPIPWLLNSLRRSWNRMYFAMGRELKRSSVCMVENRSKMLYPVLRERFLDWCLSRIQGTGLHVNAHRHPEVAGAELAAVLCESLMCPRGSDLNPFGRKVGKHTAVAELCELLHCAPGPLLTELVRLETRAPHPLLWPASMPELVHMLGVAVPVRPDLPSLAEELAANCAVRRSGVVRTLQLAFRSQRGLRYSDFPRSARGTYMVSAVMAVISKELEQTFLHRSRAHSALKADKVKVLLTELWPAISERIVTLFHGGDDVDLPEPPAGPSVNETIRRAVHASSKDMVRTDSDPSRGHYQFLESVQISLEPVAKLAAGMPPECRSSKRGSGRSPITCQCRFERLYRHGGDLVRAVCAGTLYVDDTPMGCDHAPRALGELEGDASSIRFAFAAPSPLTLFGLLDGSPQDAIRITAFALIWNASLATRMSMSALSAVAPVGAAGRMQCCCCIEDGPGSWSECAEHPLCLRCALVRVESALVDALLYVGPFNLASLEACCMPGCPCGGVSLDSLRPWLASEMRAVLYLVRNRGSSRGDIRCYACGQEAEDFDGVVSTCKACGSRSCLRCCRRAHPGVLCSVSVAGQEGPNPQEILSLIKKQACPGCGMHTVKDHGCNHMVCPCSEHWCWLCGRTVNRLDPSSHFSDTVGGDAASMCVQMVGSRQDSDQERSRMLRALDALPDVPLPAKEKCYAMLMA